ncbi:MAG: glycoside hydrolase family 3 protein [Alphaproteobacteria bacterium]|nr:glycoside hydrolase family 3 protein [Alphaproteobacteria bacterium]
MLSLDAKIALMVMVGFPDKENHHLLHQVHSGSVGGVCFFQNNFTNPLQTKEQTEAFSGLLRAIDQEGGKVQRLQKKNGFTDYPSAQAIASQKSLAEAKEIYSTLATELKSAGFNFNLAPVVDLSRDFISPAISGKERSFGSDPTAVIAYGREFIKAHNQQGIRTALKHFPGHGSARTDTHLGFTDISSDWQEDELLPYYTLTKEFPNTAVMAAHVFNRNLDPNNPASLSAPIITGLLREKIGFDGVVITDDLQMGAVRNNYSETDIIIKAIQAGADILLFGNQLAYSPAIPEQVNETVKTALKAGDISASRIDESVRRIEAFMAF